MSTHPHVKLSSIVARLDLEDVEGAGVARGGLHLEDVCRHTAPRRQVHVSVQNSEGFVPAGRVLSRTQALTAERGETHGGLELWVGARPWQRAHNKAKHSLVTNFDVR